MKNVSAENKHFAGASQLIITTTTQAVKLPTTAIARLPSPFDKDELELWNVGFWQLKNFYFCKNFTNQTIFNLFKCTN